MNEWIDDRDLPKLKTIQLGGSNFEEDRRDDRKGISDIPYNYKNTLTMRSETKWDDEWIDLPSLVEFKGNNYDFQYIGIVLLESSYIKCINDVDIPQLSTEGIYFSKYCFDYTYTIQSSSMHSFCV